MSDPDHLYPLDRRAWLLAIGRRLRVEYDAMAEPVPLRLAALVKQLEMPWNSQETSQSAGDHLIRPRSNRNEDLSYPRLGGGAMRA